LTQLTNSTAEPRMFPVTEIWVGVITLELVETVISHVSIRSIELTLTCSVKIDPMGRVGRLAGEMKSCPAAWADRIIGRTVKSESAITETRSTTIRW